MIMMNSQTKTSGLDDMIFDNRFIRELPVDSETVNNRRQVFSACYSRVLPTRVANPQMVASSREVAAATGRGSSVTVALSIWVK
jgi:hypothetical protein